MIMKLYEPLVPNRRWGQNGVAKGLSDCKASDRSVALRNKGGFLKELLCNGKGLKIQRKGGGGRRQRWRLERQPIAWELCISCLPPLLSLSFWVTSTFPSSSSPSYVHLRHVTSLKVRLCHYVAYVSNFILFFLDFRILNFLHFFFPLFYSIWISCFFGYFWKFYCSSAYEQILL